MYVIEIIVGYWSNVGDRKKFFYTDLIYVTLCIVLDFSTREHHKYYLFIRGGS